jgi:hypothetical protein
MADKPQEGMRVTHTVTGELGQFSAFDNGDSYLYITDDAGLKFLILVLGGATEVKRALPQYWPPQEGDAWSTDSSETGRTWYYRTASMGSRTGLRFVRSDSLGYTLRSAKTFLKEYPDTFLLYGEKR